MSANVLAFPAPLRLPARTRRYDLATMIDLLGLELLTLRAAVLRIRTMITTRGLPAPITSRAWGGTVVSGSAAVGRFAVWDACAVDGWLHSGPTDPGAGAAVAMPAASASLREEMRLRAQRLCGGTHAGRAQAGHAK